MKQKITIKQMVKEIFFDATNGRRNIDNYVDGMCVVDGLQYFYYRSYFERIYAEWESNEKTSRQIMDDIYQDLYERGIYSARAREVANAIVKVMYV